MSRITSQDIDRLLGLGDQFLEDWEASYEECPEGDEYPARKAEWDAARPLMLAAPDLLAALEDIAAGDMSPASAAECAREAIAKAKGV